jgi:N-acetylglucosamine-6-phosphate deacetylase
LVGDRYESAGTLSGSALTQLKSIQNLVQHVGLSLEEAINMCSVYPARLMQQKELSGTIEINKSANLLFLSTELTLLKMIENR